MEKLAQDAAKKRNLSEDIAKLLSSKRAEKRLLGTLEMAILPNSDCTTTLSHPDI